VGDAALALSALSGRDPMDSTSSLESVPDFAAALTGDIRGVRVGVPRAFVADGVDDVVRRAFDAAIEVLRDRGATLVNIELPHARYAIPVYYLICTAEASSNLARYDGVKYGHRSPSTGDDTLMTMYSRTRDEGFGAEVKRRIMLGTYVLSAGYYDAFYLKAQQVRTLLRRDYERAYEVADVIVMPTSPIPPFKLGEKTDDPLQMYLADIFTVSVNLAGLPGVSIPCGFTEGSERLPIGFQVIGRMFDEATMLKVADAYERATPWAKSVAPV
jgi:aspartyl-tRNA(Asn)/glutamyl-tRNA(Gln) amidotransferase subunit A